MKNKWRGGTGLIDSSQLFSGTIVRAVHIIIVIWWAHIQLLFDTIGYSSLFAQNVSTLAKR
jgi:hypothetical protein